MINNQHQPRIVVRVQLMTPECNRVSLKSSKDFESLSGAEVLDEGKVEFGRPIRWTIERLGDELFSCVSFVVSREEVRKAFGLDGERLFTPDEEEIELRLEARVPPVVSESIAQRIKLYGVPMPFYVLGLLRVIFEKLLGSDNPSEVVAREIRAMERWTE